MLYYRCKCGRHQAYGSMPPWPCTVCLKCGSNLATGPTAHHEPKQHVFIPVPVETNEGTRHLDRCQYCQRTRAEIQASDAAELASIAQEKADGK